MTVPKVMNEKISTIELIIKYKTGLFFFLALESELRTLLLVGRCSTDWAHHVSTPFHYGYFGDRSSIFTQPSLDLDPPVWRFLPVTGWQLCTTMRHARLFSLRWCLTNIFDQTVLKPWSFLPQPPKKIGLQ
jgi:hypothetical protein